MFDLNVLYTGIKTRRGQKIYLGDKLAAPYAHPSVVQYDSLNKEFVAAMTGKTTAPYRAIPLKDMVLGHDVHVVNNLIVYTNAAVGNTIKVSVDNIKGNILRLGELAVITHVSEWQVTARSLEFPDKEAVLNFGQFLEHPRIADIETD